MAATQDTEITLGTGRLLGLFFGLVIVCGVFFGLGYSLGRTAQKDVAVAPVTLPPPVVNASKPAAARPEMVAAATDCASKPDGCPPASGNELTFYKSVEQSAPSTPLTTDTPPTEPAPAAESKHAPEVAKPAGNNAFVVQVAAVSKPEDADALLNALRKKQYPVFIASNPAADRLFHVQIGPFNDFKEADAMRARLMSDGYNPIVKR
jgi:DedD protein